ncbi:Acetylornithine aminotransferase [Austwickia sp. TVS 96-490-7B]|uniref:acetylornithine transaminase n=1 Tax=Austwickia sp. TVS 96-490-7B TaxID=2830843 RepID=UPI001C59872A|nr:acetylornithine transaminase [Austwickia sp. TVS 96-490-7B]MBW3084367.1 Acetylornithine aminotransferase [Austwickia sp. TVS 96-490-7B]
MVVAGGNLWQQRYATAMLPVFGMPQRLFTHGCGARLWDDQGQEYVDLLAGIAVNALGHAHPALVEAVSRQAAQLIHISNFFTSEPQIALAERLLQVADAPAGSAVFFTNSGTESVEAAIKLSRRTGRVRLVAAEGAFHGRSMGALALTHKAAYREPFAPLPPDVVHVPYDDVEALRAVFADDAAPVAALFLEPIQGEAGVLPASGSYLAAARELCSRHGALLIFDEVQTGVGRTGEWFAFQRWGVVPDAMTLAKGLGGGVPIGALVTFGPEVSALLRPGQHGSTFGGNPLACAAGLAVIDTIEAEGLLAQARSVGDEIAAAVMALRHPRVAEVRGAGLLRGIGLRDEGAAAVGARLLERGVIVNVPKPRTVRIAPPLVLTSQQGRSFVELLAQVLDEEGI